MTMVDKVPFLDLAAHHAEMTSELDAAWRKVSDANAFIGGPHVEQFEEEFAAYCGTDYAVGVANGTDALELTLAALRIGSGDEVIVPANTFVATVEAIVTAGATPVFVDVDPESLVMTSAHVENAVTRRTAAVIAVHLYGQTPDLEALAKVANREGLALLEDAAQAHGARWADQPAGSFGRAATFSFYPGKNLGAFGDGGAIVTSDVALQEDIRTLANHGRKRGTHHVHDASGRNSRLDGLQAAVLSVKLRHLDNANQRRRAAAFQYRANLEGAACRMLQIADEATPVHHLEVVRVADRHRLLAELDARNIGWGLHYPIPCHKQPPFAQYANEPLPVSEQAAEEMVSVPMFPTISANEIDYVCAAIRAATEG